MWVIASSPSWNLGNGIHNTFCATFVIARGTSIIDVVNWENKLVYCTTNVGFSCRSDCCSTILNNGFFIVLIIFGATLLSSCEIDSSLTLIWNKVVHKFLAGVRNLCINCKDCALISKNFYSGMRVFNHDWTSPSYCVDVSTSSCSSSVVNVVDYALTSLIVDCTPLIVVCAPTQMLPKATVLLLPEMPNSLHQL
jgi:hypothetical protein